MPRLNRDGVDMNNLLSMVNHVTKDWSDGFTVHDVKDEIAEIKNTPNKEGRTPKRPYYSTFRIPGCLRQLGFKMVSGHVSGAGTWIKVKQ